MAIQKNKVSKVAKRVRFPKLIVLLLLILLSVSVASQALSVTFGAPLVVTEVSNATKDSKNTTDKPIITFSMEEPHENPVVILGGETIYMDYVNEGMCFVYDEYFYEPDDVINAPETSYVQIGEIPILDSSYFDKALNRYVNEVVEVKYLRNGKIHSAFRKIGDLLDYKAYSETYTSGKVCMYIPEISYALTFAHPISLDTIQGIVYYARAMGINEDRGSINVEKEPEVIGLIKENGRYGVTFEYREDKVQKNQYIEIAKKDEVQLGKAYIYTDFGEGLDFYEIFIEGFSYMDVYDDYYEELSYHGQYYDNTQENKDRFYYEFTDERMFESGIYDSHKGMSGSPIIQNGKLIGFHGYGGVMNEAIYAEIAYYDTINKFNEKQENKEIQDTHQNEQEYENKTLNSSNQPIKVIPGTKGISAMLKGIGCKIDYLKNTETDIKVGDIVVAIDGESIVSYGEINEAIEKHQNTESDKIKLTYIRDGKLYDTFIDKGVTLDADYYRYNWVANGYIPMIDPQTYRYVTNFYIDSIYNPESFSGIAIENLYKLYNKELVYYSYGNVIGSITNNGEKCLYGYMEPFSYDEEKLVEIAQKDEVKNERASIEIKLEDGSYFIIEVNAEKRDDYIKLSLLDESYYENLLDIAIIGAPVYQDGKMIGVYEGTVDPKSGYAWYAIDVYNEMMETIE